MKPYLDFHDLSQNYINIKTAVFFQVKGHLKWTEAKRETVLWSDKSKFEIKKMNSFLKNKTEDD